MILTPQGKIKITKYLMIYNKVIDRVEISIIR